MRVFFLSTIWAALCMAAGGGHAIAGEATSRELAYAREAIQDGDRGRWSDAQTIAEQSGDPFLKKLIAWMDLSRPGTDASFERISTFINANPDWPSMGGLRKRAEEAIPPTLNPQEIVIWFKAHTPTTPDGAGLFYDSLVRLNRIPEAVGSIREFWIMGTFSTDQQRDFLARFGRLLKPEDHQRRFDTLMWDGLYEDAKHLMPLLDRDDQAAGRARLVLATKQPGAEAAIAEVPADRQRDPGLLYARIRYYRGEERDDDAIKLLEKAPVVLTHPALWWTEQGILARRAIERHDYEQAYRLAESAHQTEAAQLSEAEWLAGWIALRFLHDPQRGEGHFTFMYSHVESPASRSRAAYWAARAEQDIGDTTKAEDWFAKAARYPTAFYGQLALEALRKPLVLPADPRPSASETATFERNDLVRAARLLHEVGDTSRADGFINRLAETEQTPAWQEMTVSLAHSLGIVPLSVQVAKKALQNNICDLSGGFPVLRGISPREPEPALVHGIIRQESLFNQAAFSPAGAIGLMQLMPATAQGEARKLGIRHTTEMLSQSAEHNVALGSHYLAGLIDGFDGSYVLAIASYNAGSSRIRGWMRDNGDPRHDVDPIDWIEMIPIAETRNYVQRVLENTQVYRVRLGGGPVPVHLLEDLKR